MPAHLQNDMTLAPHLTIYLKLWLIIVGVFFLGHPVLALTRAGCSLSYLDRQSIMPAHLQNDMTLSPIYLSIYLSIYSANVIK